jgi:hypothetical protein
MSPPQITNPFKHLSAEQREMIEDAYKAGQTPEQIGIQFGLDYDDVRFYVENFIQPPRSHFERLQEIVDDLEDQCAKTKLAIDSGESSAMMLQSYQRLMAEYRIALAELMALQKPQDVVDELVDKSFNPFVVNLIRACTEEMNNLQQEMLKLDVPLRDAKGISTEIFKRLSDRVRALLPEAKESLDTHFGVKKQEREARAAEAREKTIQ